MAVQSAAHRPDIQTVAAAAATAAAAAGAHPVATRDRIDAPGQNPRLGSRKGLRVTTPATRPVFIDHYIRRILNGTNIKR